MHPYLVANHFIRIPTYAICFILGFALVTLWAGFRTRAMGLDPDVCPELLIWVAPISMIGAKAFWMIHYLLLGRTPVDTAARFWKNLTFSGGFIAFGGILAGIATAYLFMREKKLDFRKYGDAYAPALGLGVFVMRLGCLFSGCCWGKGDFGFFCLNFPKSSHAGYYQYMNGYSGLFPSQLLAAADGLLIAAALLVLEKKVKRPGALFFAFVLLYACARFGEDFTRYYAISETFLSLTYNQWTSLVIIAVLLGGLRFLGMADATWTTARKPE